MGSYCQQCMKDVYPDLDQPNDFVGLVEHGYLASVLCEGCGLTLVNSKGECVGPCLNKGHNKQVSITGLKTVQTKLLRR